MALSDCDKVPFPRPIEDVLTKTVGNSHTHRHPGSLLVCVNATRLFLYLHEKFKNDPEWNFKISIHDKDSFVNGTINTTKEDASVSFIGWREPEHKHTWYHYFICPSRFTRATLNQLIPGTQPEISKLYEWAQSLYQFTQDNGLKMSGSAGGLAAQLLRDVKFYNEKRRKVPQATNERAREALPGNHYEMRGVPNRIYSSALYFDQENAHHYAAATLELPKSDWLYARGFFHEKKKWCEPGSAEYQQTVYNEYGLLYARIWVPKFLDGYLPPWAGRHGTHDAYIFTNEIPFLESLGVEIRYLYAAWTSPEKDTGLAKYSAWAQEQIQSRPHEKVWLKPLLLSTYGVLASKPRRYEFGYYRANGPVTNFNIGVDEIQIVRTSTKRENQLPVANVIHRGMIEAETRRISIELARQFEFEKREVISIYADGVIIKEDNIPLPLLPTPWRPKHRLQFLAFTDATSFESDLMCKQPGRRRNVKV